MPVCGSCEEEVTDAILCAVCDKYYDFGCAGITESKYRRLGERKKREWSCHTCNFNSPTDDVPPPSTSTTSTPPTLEMVMQRLDSLSLQLAPLKSLEVIKSDISKLKTSTNNIAKRIDTLEARVTKVEDTQPETGLLKDKILQLESALELKDQWLRSNNCEIKGIPQKHGENLYDLLSKVGESISYPVTKEKINFIARVPIRDGGKSTTKPIIVSFTNRYDKENFVAAGRAKKDLNLSNIGLQGTSRIFINDHLTAQQKHLLGSAKSLAKEKDFQYIWVNHGKILARRNATSPVVQIKTHNDLAKIN
ncbi:unnamed protein product [Plutella xylostella]|uniref:(diamondback moth) hypothetical protein n=1 Tax=Plutella xylostella TaxID=51655 RepID=A0A8S4G7B7_PLUXY|nr:unnamed protein product [Plutella xylostella]